MALTQTGRSTRNKPPRNRLRHVPGAAGADEAGRGPLAGPVVAAAVILPNGMDLRGIVDSKRIPPQQREELAEKIKAQAIWSVVALDHREVDRLNILWASMEAMCLAIESLGAKPIRVLIDGDRVPTRLCGYGEAVVKGDDTYACIAAASILAKTTRDRMMREFSLAYPQYGFESHFGYSTPEHFEALRTHGPCEIHRRTFAPVRSLVEQGCLIFAE